MGKTPMLKIENLSKTYHQGPKTVEVLKDINLEVASSEVVALVGQSGSGKSTLLHCLGLLDRVDSGSISIEGRKCDDLSDKKRTYLRRAKIGFVYQFHHLQAEFSALENVMIPLIISGVPKKEAKEKAAEFLVKLGLSERLTHRPADLSGGEQQRVAIARALIHDPKVLLSDEPTGNLDPDTSARVFETLLEAARGSGTAVILATHNFDLAEQADRMISLESGVLIA